MDAMQVVVGTAFLVLGIAWLISVQHDRPRPPEQRRNFKTWSLLGPTLAGLFYLLLAAWWLGRGLLS